MSCGVGRRGGSDPELLWLWLWLATLALILPLAWELSYAVGAVLKRQKKKKKKKKKEILGQRMLIKGGIIKEASSLPPISTF